MGGGGIDIPPPPPKPTSEDCDLIASWLGVESDCCNTVVIGADSSTTISCNDDSRINKLEIVGGEAEDTKVPLSDKILGLPYLTELLAHARGTGFGGELLYWKSVVVAANFERDDWRAGKHPGITDRRVSDFLIAKTDDGKLTEFKEYTHGAKDGT
ncbi:hypothetical protein HDU97_008864 [Phlyctochytrium planicorne]|nr:hypothetical protein HDU97_008864 [Phlyctochytrium planicorne]